MNKQCLQPTCREVMNLKSVQVTFLKNLTPKILLGLCVSTSKFPCQDGLLNLQSLIYRSSTWLSFQSHQVPAKKSIILSLYCVLQHYGPHCKHKVWIQCTVFKFTGMPHTNKPNLTHSDICNLDYQVKFVCLIGSGSNSAVYTTHKCSTSELYLHPLLQYQY